MAGTDFTLREAPPTVAEYLHLRAIAERPTEVRLYGSSGLRASAPAPAGMFRRFAQVPGGHP